MESEPESEASRMVWPEETPRDGGGFRRLSRFPEPMALARLRARLLDAASGGAGPVEDGLAGFQSWKFLITLCESAWTAGARRDSAAARRLLQRRLRMLGIRATSFAAAAALPAGAAVHLRGVARAMPAHGPDPEPSHIWRVGTSEVGLLVEEGRDFFLTGEAGETACVIAARGHLINADRLADGDAVSVFGFVDRIADARAQARSVHARGELSLALRSGDALPLLVRRVGPAAA
jgi:hypothetical protein